MEKSPFLYIIHVVVSCLKCWHEIIIIRPVQDQAVKYRYNEMFPYSISCNEIFRHCQWLVYFSRSSHDVHDRCEWHKCSSVDGMMPWCHSECQWPLFQNHYALVLLKHLRKSWYCFHNMQMTWILALLGHTVGGRNCILAERYLPKSLNMASVLTDNMMNRKLNINPCKFKFFCDVCTAAGRWWP